MALLAPAVAQEESARDRLIDLATIQVSRELCHFDLTDAQDDALTAARNKLLDDGEVSDTEVTDIHDQLSAAMARQVSEGLCRSNGAGERLFKQKLAALGAP